MSMQFDATVKRLSRDDPVAVLTTFDRPPAGVVSLLNVDLSTVTTAADFVVGVGEPLKEVVHIDFQASAAAWKHADILTYNALLYENYHVPVHSVMVLLRPKAAHRNVTGTVSYATRRGRGRMDFRYELVSVWKRPAMSFLAGPVGALPFAVLGELPPHVSKIDALNAVSQKVIERIEREVGTDRGRILLTAAYVLSGLRVSLTVARRAFRGIRDMRESTTYMAILDEGREEQAKDTILRQGHKRFGQPPEAIQAKLRGISNLERLDRILDHLLDATGWQDLIDTP